MKRNFLSDAAATPPSGPVEEENSFNFRSAPTHELMKVNNTKRKRKVLVQFGENFAPPLFIYLSKNVAITIYGILFFKSFLLLRLDVIRKLSFNTSSKSHPKDKQQKDEQLGPFVYHEESLSTFFIISKQGKISVLGKYLHFKLCILSTAVCRPPPFVRPPRPPIRSIRMIKKLHKHLPDNFNEIYKQMFVLGIICSREERCEQLVCSE